MEQFLKYVFVNSFKNNNHKLNTLTQITTFIENNHIFQNEENQGEDLELEKGAPLQGVWSPGG